MLGIPRHLSSALPAVSVVSCFPLPATSALASQRVETALPEPRSAGLLSTSRPCVCPRPSERAGSVAAPRRTWRHTWRVLSPSFPFRFWVLLHTDISGGCQFSPQCALPAEMQGAGCASSTLVVVSVTPFHFSFWYVGCLRVSPTRGAGDHAVEVPGPVERRWSLIGVPFLRRYDENGQGVSISSP